MRITSTYLAAIAAAITAPGAASAAQAGPGTDAPSASTSAQRCAALTSADFSRLAEAPTQILKIKSVEATAKTPAYCDVHGAVMPNVGFQLKLPMANWNGRFFEAGCGNYCGILYPRACDEPLRRGYACVVTDSGHVARIEDPAWTDAQWAYNNLQAELDWGGRASHVTAVAGKAIVENFYGKWPTKSYFMGCSYGGHQAMVLAQRFPYDFDGIVGGGVPNNISTLMQQNSWAISTAYDAQLKSVFSEGDIKVLHDAALARCDLDDGLKDGLVSNPGACKVNVDELVCKAGNTAGCLSPEIADVAKKAYSGPVNSKGEKLSGGGWASGSELFWRNVYRPDGTGLVALAQNYFRYMGRLPDIGPKWSARDYDFDRDYKQNDVMETLYAAANPDLRRFKQAGGKLINYVGWNDLGTTPGGSIDYYETAERTMGGRAATQDFFRMFMIPGALHCRGGEGADDVDFISYIEAWVEQGKAPDVMIGAHRGPSGDPTFTRPLYPYPRHAKYKGSGDPNDAANFKAVDAR
jgi:feruloyl esterase